MLPCVLSLDMFPSEWTLIHMSMVRLLRKECNGATGILKISNILKLVFSLVDTLTWKGKCALLILKSTNVMLLVGQLKSVNFMLEIRQN